MSFIPGMTGPVSMTGALTPLTLTSIEKFRHSLSHHAAEVAYPTGHRKGDVVVLYDWKYVEDKGVTETKQAKEGAGVALTGGVLEVARQQVQQVADQVSWIPGLEWLSTILAMVVALLVLGGLAWAAYGWWKARQTDEGDIVDPDDVGAPDAIDEVLA